MSNLLLVNDALSLIGVLPEGINASAEQGELALRVIDEMAEEWAEDGVVVNWAPSTLDDDCPLSGGQKTAVKHHLAVRLCPYFGREPSPTLIALAQSAYQKIQRKQMVDAMEPVSVPLPAAESSVTGWDYTTGGF